MTDAMQALDIYRDQKAGRWSGGAASACAAIREAPGNRAWAIYRAHQEGWWTGGAASACAAIREAPGDRASAIYYAQRNGWWDGGAPSACAAIREAPGNRAWAIYRAHQEGWWTGGAASACAAIRVAPGEQTRAIYLAQFSGWWGSEEVSNTHKAIPGFDKYTIDKDGVVLMWEGNELHAVPQRPDGRGYLCVDLVKPGVKQTRKVHRLVWETHVDLIPESLHIDHINHDKLDNRLTNLRLRSVSENSADCAKTSRAGMRVLNERQRRMVGTLILSDFKTKEIAVLCSIGETTVRRLRKRLRAGLEEANNG